MDRKYEDLGKQIYHISVLYRRNFDHVIARQSAGCSDILSSRNIWILRYISERKGEDVFQKDLESTFKVRRSTVSGTVELMEQKGLLIREAVCGDARLKRLRLTPKAEEILNAVSEGIGRLEEQVRNSFSEEDYGRFSDLLERLSGILELPLPSVDPEDHTGKE